MHPRWRSSLVERLGLTAPIIQGPFGGGISSVRLVAAVASAGGLGSFGAHVLSGNDIIATAREIRALTSSPFNLNLWVPLPGEGDQGLSDAEFAAEAERLRGLREILGLPPPSPPGNYAPPPFAEQLDAVIEARPPVASFVFGVPPPAALRELKRRGVLTVGAATTVEEARVLAGAGFDAIVASGSDAGGHRPSFLRAAEESLVGTFSLVPQVVDAVPVPVIAAGGIADGRGVVAALTLGAAAAQVGTAFLAADESNASAGHKEALTTEAARDTVLTRVFSGRLARGLRNHVQRELERSTPVPPPYPIRSWFMAPVARAAAQQGRTDLQVLWAGQAAALGRRRPAREVFEQLAQEAAALLTPGTAR